RVEVDAGGATREALGAAARGLMSARTLPRTRVKGTSERRYDLRPLLADVTVGGDAEPARAGAPVAIRLRTRIHPELGVGRPEEVVAALADAVGSPLEMLATARERLVLADDLPPRGRRQAF
ncbi:MAG TPA: hypothetical protein VK194_11090, partial [Candidatus Deferrimicrobium sp.]|nr:hypothetical protein [Candidatus Deferrimicrobium sp.]